MDRAFDGSPNLRPGAHRFPTSAAPRYDAGLPIDVLFADFIAASASIINDATERTYTTDWGYFRAWLDEAGLEPVLGTLTKQRFVDYIAHQQRRPKRKGRGPLSSHSVNTYTRVLRTFVRWLVAEGYYPSDPFAGGGRGIMPRLGLKVLRAAKLSDVDRLLEGTEKPSTRPLNRVEKACRGRDALCVLVAADTGLRTGDLARLELDDLDFADGWGTVRHGKGDRARRIPLSRPTIGALRAYLRRDRPFLSGLPAAETRPSDRLILTASGAPMGPNAIYQAMTRTNKRAGGSAGFGLHRFRHLFGTEAAEGGMHPLISQTIMGHADERSQRQYQHPSDAAIKREHAKVTPIRAMKASRRRKLA